MIVYVLVGGMKGTTYVQIIKAVLLLRRRGGDGDLGARLRRASTSAGCSSARPPRSPHGRAMLEPGLQYTNPIDFVSLALALVLGTAGLPHILMRFYTVPERAARRGARWCGRSG